MEHGENPIKSFELYGINKPVSFVSKSDVIEGVVCDVYSFVEDNRMDLGIVTIQPGKKTPLQKVLLGDKTIEGFIAGKGKLTITKLNGETVVYIFEDERKDIKSIPVMVGETMQWEADEDSELIFSEVCYPPYEEG
ncbi:MAG: hypothetical protein Q7T59_05815 [Candidatus Woesebacteria bacterium]|nr:hypothetical protein [Candidatus Woesebacteria bacterium]